jgi:hypothetical protein
MAMADGDDTANVYPEDQQRICVRCLASYHFSVQTLIKEFTTSMLFFPNCCPTLNMLQSSFSLTFFLLQ